MTISQALNTANSGLSASSQRAATVSGNIANALTEGYSRRVVSTSEQIVGGLGQGVVVDSVERVSDPSLTAGRRLAEAESNRDSAIATIQNQISRSLGGPEDEYSFFSVIDDFENSFASLRETPESTIHQQNVLGFSEEVVRNLNQLSQENLDNRVSADREISRQVDAVNNALEEVAKLNTEIATAGASGVSTAALEDQRQLLIDEISNIIPVKEVPKSGGEVDLITNEGVYLLAGQAREVQFTRTSPITADMTFADGDLGGLTVDGVDITPGGAGGLSVKGGTIVAQFEIRDEITITYQQQLDAMAADLIERFEDPAVDPTLTAGDPGLFTDNGSALADPFAIGLASRIEVNAAVDPERGGELWRLRDGVGAAVEGVAGNADIVSSFLDGLRAPRTIDGPGFTGEFSISEAAADFVSIRSAEALNAETRATISQTRSDGLRDAEAQVSGVDTDAELQELLRIEQAYNANARVIQVINEMLGRLLEI